jgi:S1-C subfamily serine protease
MVIIVAIECGMNATLGTGSSTSEVQLVAIGEPDMNEWTIRLQRRALQTVPREILRSSVVPLLVREDGGLRGIGSAFPLAATGLKPGLVLYATARHVAAELGESGATEMFALLPLDPIAESQLVTVRVTEAVVMDKTSDAALLLVDLDTASQRLTWQPRGLALTLARPLVGQQTLALGYARHEVGRRLYEDTFSSALLASVGVIQEIHPQRRDNFMIDYPSFRTDAQYESGMSGGPILAPSGHVMGIVSTGFRLLESGCGEVAYGAQAATLMELPLPRASGRHGTTFGDLLASGEIRSEPSSVMLTRTDEGLQLNWPGV